MKFLFIILNSSSNYSINSANKLAHLANKTETQTKDQNKWQISNDKSSVRISFNLCNFEK